MEKSINIKIQEVKHGILQLLVQAQLPASISALIITEVATQVNQEANAILQKEVNEYKASLDTKETIPADKPAV